MLRHVFVRGRGLRLSVGAVRLGVIPFEVTWRVPSVGLPQASTWRSAWNPQKGDPAPAFPGRGRSEPNSAEVCLLCFDMSDVSTFDRTQFWKKKVSAAGRFSGLVRKNAASIDRDRGRVTGPSLSKDDQLDW